MVKRPTVRARRGGSATSAARVGPPPILSRWPAEVRCRNGGPGYD